MAKPKNKYPSMRVRLDGYIQMKGEGVTADPRQQVLYDFLVANGKSRKAFPMAIELLIAALNGELGPQVKSALSDGNTEEAREALSDLIDMFVS